MEILRVRRAGATPTMDDFCLDDIFRRESSTYQISGALYRGEGPTKGRMELDSRKALDAALGKLLEREAKTGDDSEIFIYFLSRRKILERMYDAEPEVLDDIYSGISIVQSGIPGFSSEGLFGSMKTAIGGFIDVNRAKIERLESELLKRSPNTMVLM